jgi:thioredoxin reductase
MNMEHNDFFDVIVIGGSHSGLSAALSLGRTGRKVLLLDNNLSCNRYTALSHNFLTQDGQQTKSIAEIAEKQVRNYPTVEIVKDTAIYGQKISDDFEIVTLKENHYKARKILFASGITDILPDIKGFKECWGSSIVHCPYCHGHEYRQQKTAILGNGEAAFEMARILKNLTSDIVIISNKVSEFDEDQLHQLKRNNIKILQSEPQEILHNNGQIYGIALSDDLYIDVGILYTSLPFRQSSEIPQMLGCRFTHYGLIEVDDKQRTSIKGIYACGDNSSMMRSISRAVYTGNLAGAVINTDLSIELF